MERLSISLGYETSYPPQTEEVLRDCQRRAGIKIEDFQTFDCETLNVYFRTVCLPGFLFNQGIRSMARWIDLETMLVLQPEKNTELSRITAFADRAVQAARLLYQRNDAVLTVEEYEQEERAKSNYCSFVKARANDGLLDLSLDELHQLAAFAATQRDAALPHRDWKALLSSEVRWCLAAPESEWSILMREYPETRPYLTPLMLLCDTMPAHEALPLLWHAKPCTFALALPEDLLGP